MAGGLVAAYNEVTTMKKCPKCGETKAFSDFYANKRRADGVQTYCVSCTREYQAERQRLRKPETRPYARRSVREGNCKHPGGCPNPIQANGLCNMHAQRVWSKGDPGPVESLRAKNGEGSLDPSGYRVVTVDGKRMLEHRYVMEMMLGRPLLKPETVHHKNGQRADNRPLNLELWSHSQPKGQRVEDKLAWAREFIALYGETQLKL